MKKELSAEHKAMLGFIRQSMEELYNEVKETLKLDGESPDLGHSLENAVAAQQSFELIMGDLIANHKDDGNVCPVVLGAALTKMLVNSLRPQIQPDGTIVCHSSMASIVKSFSSMVSLPLAMHAWDSFVRKDLDNSLDTIN